eukprot:1673835-Pyramimonas_sp.AAC.1
MTVWRGSLNWVTLQTAEFFGEEAVEVWPPKPKPRKGGADGSDEDSSEEDDEEDDRDMVEFLADLMEGPDEYDGGESEEELAEHPEEQELDADGDLPDGDGGDT